MCTCASVHTRIIVPSALPSHVPSCTCVCAYSALCLSLDFQTYEQGLKQLPSWDTGGTVQLITMRAQAEEALGQHKAAQDSYLRATEVLPLNYMTWCVRAFACVCKRV